MEDVGKRVGESKRGGEDEGEDEGRRGESKCYGTRTGKLWHRDRGCRYLRSAKQVFPVKPLAHLAPCYLCAVGGEMEVFGDEKRTLGSGKEAFGDEKEVLKGEKGMGGKETKGKGDLEGTGNVTTGNVEGLEGWEGYSKESSLLKLGREFVATKHGRKFHLAECRTVGHRETKPCLPAMGKREPCRVCLVGLFQEWEVCGLNSC